jgi:microcystin-dependent protein
MDPFLGEIRIVGFSYAPQGWALCNGQSLSIAQNNALFALLGTTYGGNGTSTFNLPDLQGRFPLHPGNGAGLPVYTQGQKAGSPTASLIANNLPPHAHPLNITNAPGAHSDPTGALIAQFNTGSVKNPTTTSLQFATGTPTGTMAPNAIGPNISTALPFGVQNAYLGLYFVIALQGIFPVRN